MRAAIFTRLALLEAWRGGLPWIAVASVALAVALGAYLGQLALTEGRLLQASVVAAVLRVCAVFIVAAQLAWRSAQPPASREGGDLPPAPDAAALRLAAFGEPEALARVLMLYLQAFDYHGSNTLTYARLDYRRLMQWLQVILELDPRSEYPLMAAARIYAETADAERSRLALDFVYREFLRDPARRWQWLAHGALLAKHRLHDLPLARRYAAAVAERTRGVPGVPLWARQMQVFILEDMNELEAAKIMLGGLLESGTLSDPEEARYLELHLRELERRSAQPK